MSPTQQREVRDFFSSAGWEMFENRINAMHQSAMKKLAARAAAGESDTTIRINAGVIAGYDKVMTMAQQMLQDATKASD